MYDKIERIQKIDTLILELGDMCINDPKDSPTKKASDILNQAALSATQAIEKESHATPTNG